MRVSVFIALAALASACGGGGGSGGTNPPVFTSLVVSPSTVTLAPGDTATLTATPKDQNGATMAGLGSATWTSGDATIATVNANSGLVTGVMAGGPVQVTASLTASGVTRNGASGVTVNAPGNSATVTATTGLSFDPGSVTISQGGTVTWNFQSVTHNVTFTTAGAPANIGDTSNGSVARTFNTKGTFNYHCTIHAGMNGTVVVQ